MQIGSIVNIGVQGFQEASSRASQAAQNIASQSVTNAAEDSINKDDLTQNLVDLKTAELDAKANAKVIQTASDVLGTLLDVTV